MADGGNLFRSADGTPGPEYWQNEADYQIEAELDTAAKVLTGNVRITYTNNSPNDLQQLWLELVHNSRKADSRAAKVRGNLQEGNGKNGFDLHNVRIKLDGKWQKANYKVLGTRMQIRLSDALQANGTDIQIDISYEYSLPERGRGGYLSTKNGTIYEVSYWYPRMHVYDDMRGWNTRPFLGAGEFYLDYGTIDYKVTLPEGMLMAGSGELMNPGETLTQEQQQRLKKARHSEETVMIRSEDELNKPATAKGVNGKLTWHYRMEKTRDVAWAASKAFMWDAATAKYESGKKTLAMSYYPVESAGEEAWGRATEYLKRSLEIFSDKWFEYPYPAAVNVGGPTGGMEYPGITFDSWKAKGYTLFLLVAHEIGHNWYPMIVGSDESRNPWMDEGFNTFIDIYAHEEFNDGEYAPKRDGEYAPGGGNPAEEIIPVITQDEARPMLSRSDALKSDYYHPLEYFKPALGLVLLREVILEPEQFDYAFRQYTHDWAYKHPGAKDFFRSMNNYTGEDLSWFWKGWFINNWKLDQAVTDVTYDENPSNGATITLKNMEQMVMPVFVNITTADGNTSKHKLPVEVWMKDETFTFNAPTTQKILKVELDAERQLPDVNRDNNIWSAK
jgi:aminopeptidase N